MKHGMIIDEDGNKYWYINGKVHREDRPAVESANGSRYWYQTGLLHREDGPAVEWPNGDKAWWVNGKLHRVDGPAVEEANGNKHWFLNGKLHREDGPARERGDGYKAWYLNGNQHREDGPAREWANGRKEWHLNGVKVTEQIVMHPETIAFAQIQKSRNNEVRSIMIERYGWQRYLADSKAKMIDKRDNAVENTKEALFVTRSFGNRLVVTCPTGRVFTLGVPSDVVTCEAAQQWLGNSTTEINVIGRT